MSHIFLFDVDQTLLYSGGAGSLAMRRAFHQLYGIEDGFRRVEFSGRTDWGILRNAMQQHGLGGSAEEDFREEMGRFQETYYRLLEPALREVESGRVMPGIAELLGALAGREGVRMGLGTGNFRQAAFLKLRHFGLDGYLSEGGFGDDAEDRGELIGIAIERVGGSYRGDSRSIWVIGDTPLDIAAAQANGARSLGVATGKDSVEVLLAAGADLALADLSETQAVLAALLAEGQA